jgi:hypothetical protein
MRVELLTPTPASQLTRMHAVGMLLEEPLRAGTPIADRSKIFDVLAGQEGRRSMSSRCRALAFATSTVVPAKRGLGPAALDTIKPRSIADHGLFLGYFHGVRQPLPGESLSGLWSV